MNRIVWMSSGVALLVLAGCGAKSSHITAPPASALRQYNGTASVGDFLTLSVDGAAHALSFFNRTNGDSGTVPYTVNGDGSYTLADPSGNLLTAYEVPNFVMMVQAAKTGPNHDTPSLVTAVQSSAISLASIENHHYNYMQFRTTSGGIEAGSCLIDESGVVNNSSYWPFGAQSGGNAFHSGQVSTNGVIEDPSGTFLRLPDGDGGNDYIFGTPNGMFAVDNSNGAILGFAQAASKNFDAARAGAYHAIFYRKTNAMAGVNNTESGTASLGSGTLTVTAGGGVTLSDGATTLASGTLAAVADTPSLYGAVGQLGDPCNGLFTFQTTTTGAQQDVFLTFVNGAVLFSSFATALPMSGGNPYDYFYGVALQSPTP